MGFLLKEMLKALCGSNQWSYAVFWKIGCQNTKLLIWEECHYQLLPSFESSGSGSSKLPPGEWEGCWGYSQSSSTQQANHVEDKLYSLINKMSNKQISLVGEGIVGRAAFTGNHQWILSSNYTGDAYPPEVLNELHQQFLAGMQTVAVIPVLPHGVVQLGSSFAIMENSMIINDVKNLILHLGSVPGALLSETYDGKDPVEKIGVPVTLGMTGLTDPSQNCNVMKPLTTDDNCNPLDNSLLASRSSQPSNLLFREIRSNNHLAASSTLQSPHLTQGLAMPHQNLGLSKVTQAMKPNLPSRDNLEYGRARAEVILPNPEARFHQQASFSSFYNSQSGVSSTAGHSSLKLVGNQNLSAVSIQQDVYNCLNSSNSCNLSQLVTHGGRTIDNENSSVTTNHPLIESRQSKEKKNIGSKQFSVPVSISNDHGATGKGVNGGEQGGIEVQNGLKSKAEEVSLSGGIDCAVTPGQQSQENSSEKAILEAMKSSQLKLSPSADNDLFEALNTTWTQLESAMSLNDYMSGLSNDYLNHFSGFESSRLPHIKNEQTCILSSSGDDLFDILGVEYKNKLLTSNWNSLSESVHNEDRKNSYASQIMNVLEAGLSSNISSTSRKIPESGINSITASDQLLDAVVSRGHSAIKQSSDDSTSCRTTLTKISNSSGPSSLIYGQPSASNHMQRGVFGIPKSLGEVGTLDNSSFRSGCRQNDMPNCSQSSSVYGSQCSWVEQGDNLKRDSSVSTAYSKRPDEVNKSSRKRLKPGENPRPRPKDRQMIQDRVKELREIVPNGAKCSIDALLEKTIKHMLFLQSVTKHADKLKQTGESKIISREGGLFLNDNFEGGATWAFEVGSQTMVCPIIVEDLNPPRQMLVEMLCEERGFFLEIADLIRGMGLTILKGVMEARDDKIWARFAVEANRDVTRMEIFMSLVRLLDQTLKGNNVSMTNAIDNSHMIVHNSLPQSTPISATGRPGSLQ
ncbi:transcription factor LHW-like [Benincasa hispida]|uniref:transcription factor LHW-like n=1 Tax=Benincasa hispida TaxID=102211 RepID=UPI0019024F10|nr:transcription factor LHW-like [Benincasa hispida]